MSRLIVWIVASALVASAPAAQRGAGGTGAISGRVVTTTDPATPLARALVTISGALLTPGRTTITDDEGRFAFQTLPSGSFTIVAARPPYVKTAFGAKRPGRPGTPIDLAAGQQLAGITIALARGAALTGMIRDPDGEAAPDVRVQAMPLDSETIAPGASAVTDDRGVYRLFGLSPGRYVVTAEVSDEGRTQLTQLSDDEIDEIIARLQRRSAGLAGAGARRGGGPQPESTSPPPTYGYASIHYPGTADPDQAAEIVLAEGEERGGLDIALQLVRTAAIDGRVTSDGGVLPAGTQVTLTRQAVRAGSTPATARQIDATGEFRFTGVLPGRYRLVARAMTTTRAGAPAPGAASSTPQALTVKGTFWALADVTVVADDVRGVALMLQPGLRLSGRIVFDARTAPPPRDLATVRLRLVDVGGSPMFIPPGSGRADGTFEISGLLPGTYTMTSPLSDSGWWLRSVMVDGRDVLDFPLELGPAGDVTGAVVTFTDRHTELAGTLQSPARIAAPDYFIVVFPTERAFWRPASRRVQFTRPDTAGRFRFRALPAGDYLIAALTDLEPRDLLDPFFVERLVAAGVAVRIADGETTTQDLRIAR
jgi:hypothetical protein